ncbi:MAG: hypothetical protein GYA41_04860 [Bacteroidales bacterium]|nr:hypothetical protein [Bacteroidales bacterium]
MSGHMNFYMGIDIGTSGCKAVIFDESGNQISKAYREYDIISVNPGWAELDTDEVISGCFQVIREAASSVTIGTIRGIGISSQGEAFTLLDRDGKALCNALVSSDSRANKLIRPWVEDFGEERLYNITGHTPYPMFSLFKLLWVRNNMPEIWKRAQRIMCFEDLLQYRLGIATPSIGWPLAGRTMLFDVIRHEWNDEILEKSGIRREMMSIPLQSGSFAGVVERTIARSLNLPDNTYIVTGGHDQPCSGLGAGAIMPGVAVYSSGTVECITPAFSKPVMAGNLRKSNLCTYDHAAPGMYATVAFSLTGGNILKWFRDEFGYEEKHLSEKSGRDAYELLINKMSDEPSRLIVLPYFTPSGTPYFDVSVKGAILGFDLTVKREELIRALLEGVAFEMRLNLEILEQSGCPVNELRIMGGGARSLKHVQLKADVTGMPITVLDVSEAGCMGVAMLARSYHTKDTVEKIAGEWIKPVARIEPAKSDHYNLKFQQYKKLYPMLKTFY